MMLIRSRFLSLLSPLALVAATASACASVAVPQDRLTSSESSIRAADELGAENEPRAALHLQLARENLAKAKELIAAGEHDLADIALQKALADSELAIAMTKETSARADAVLIGKEVLTLRSAG